jgi:hypothetical protein
MARVILIVVVFGLVVIGIGVLALGAFPPHAHEAPVSHVIPNDRFHSD